MFTLTAKKAAEVSACAELSAEDREPKRRSITVDIDHGLGKGMRRLLRQIVPDAALYGSVSISAGEFFGIGAWVRTRRTVGITLKGNRRYGDHLKCGKPLFQLVILRLAFSQSKPPTIIYG
jgi:hypothetical protein